MKPARCSDEVLADIRSSLKAEKFNGLVYTHPVGDHGHGAGPLVGLWDRQQGVPGRGDVRLIPNSWFAIELAARTKVPEWNNEELWVGQEENAAIDAQGRIAWVLRRQTEFHLVK